MYIICILPNFLHWTRFILATDFHRKEDESNYVSIHIKLQENEYKQIFTFGPVAPAVNFADPESSLSVAFSNSEGDSSAAKFAILVATANDWNYGKMIWNGINYVLDTQFLF